MLRRVSQFVISPSRFVAGVCVDCPRRSPTFSCNVSNLQAESIRVPEVAIGESVQKAKSGYAPKPCGWCQDPDGSNIVIESQGGYLHTNYVHRKRTAERAPKDHGWRRNPTAQKTIILPQQKLE